MSVQRGREAEQKACDFLRKKGFKILKQNYTIRGGEIDIIATKDGVLHFVEVKSGKNFEPSQNITHEKISRIAKTAQTYIKKNSLNMPFCIDAIIIKNDINFFENITL